MSARERKNFIHLGNSHSFINTNLDNSHDNYVCNQINNNVFTLSYLRNGKGGVSAILSNVEMCEMFSLFCNLNQLDVGFKVL